MNPRALSASGKSYGTGYYFCNPCWEKNQQKSPLVRCTSGTTNLVQHLKTKHKKEWTEANEPRAAAAPRAPVAVQGGASHAPVTSNPNVGSSAGVTGERRQTTLGGGTFGMVKEHRRLVAYTQKQLQRQYTSALVSHNRAANQATDEEMIVLFKMLGFDLPCYRTMMSTEEEFQAQAKKCIRDELLCEGIIGAEPTKLDLPIISISYDTTPLPLKGVHAISLNGHYVTKDFVPMRILFHTGAFSVPEAEEREGITRGTSGNLAAFAVSVLKEFGIVPASVTDNKIGAYVFAATTDNASAEVKAAIDVLGIISHRCGNHTFDLPLKRTLKVRTTKRVELLGQSVQEDVQVPEDDEEEAETRTSIVENLSAAILIDRAAIAAAKMNKGNGAAKFMRLQTLAGVDAPKVLITRAETRFAMSARITDRVLELRQFVDEGLELLKLPAYTDEEWRTLLQVGAFLREAEDLTIALQSREYLIGDHIGKLYAFMELLRHPETMRVHPHSFVPSVIQLNQASRRGAGGPAAHEDSFDMWDKKHRTQFLTSGVMTEATREWLERLKEDYEWRLSHDKQQFSSMPALLATALHPLYKNFIYDPQQHGLFDAVTKGRAVNFLKRLLDKVTLNSSPAAAAGACDEEPPAKKPKPGILAVNLPGYSMPASVATATDDEQEAWKKVELTPSTLADFWKGQVNSNAPRFKKLVRVARAVGGVPNVSAECERDFSAAKALLGSQRHGLLPDTVARKLFLMANRRMWQANPGVQLPA